MNFWEESPVVSFARDGEELTLGRDPNAPVLHLNGSTGLAFAPVEMSASPRLSGDGSVLRGVRYGDREVFVPLLMEAESVGELTRARRDLNALLAPHRGDVDVRIQDPVTGTDRTIRGRYKSGLEGDFGSDYHGNWQTFGITFLCHNPWWLGPEKASTLRLNPGTKPFLSEGAILRRNLVPNPLGSGAVDVGYWKSVRGDFEIVEVDGAPAGRFTKTGDIGQGYVDPTIHFSPPPETTFRFSAEVRVSVETEMRLRVSNYEGAEPDLGDYVTQTPAEGWVRREVVVPVSAMPEGGYFRTLVWPRAMAPGDQFWIRNVLVEVDTDGDYFDGSSVGCKWVGGAEGPESIMWDPSNTSPFFPVTLAQSAVVGEFTVTVGGDGPVFPSWEIYGPGTDLRIVRGSDRIAIDGEIRAGESILIDTANGRIVPDVWEDVSLDTRLFPLDPGSQTLTVTMVGATVETEVRMIYRERHLEGY